MCIAWTYEKLTELKNTPYSWAFGTAEKHNDLMLHSSSLPFNMKEEALVILRDGRSLVCTFPWTSEMLGTKTSIVKASG